MPIVEKGGRFMVLSSIEDKTVGGKRYYKLRVKEPHSVISNEPMGDGAGKSIILGLTYDAKMWDDAIRLMEANETSLPEAGQIWTDVAFERDSWKGTPQLVIRKYKVVTNLTARDRLDFLDPPTIDVDVVIDQLFNWDWPSDLSYLMSWVGKELGETGLLDKLKNVPAGSVNHHNRRGGLLQHTKEMVDFAAHICRVDPITNKVNGILGFPIDLVDFPILRAAIIVHDLGKVHEYNSETLQWEADFEGQCLGHSTWGTLAIERHWPKDSSGFSVECSRERKLKLQHAILAHHGKDIAAVPPSMPEAVLLCSVDILSASLDVHREARRLSKEGKRVPFNKTIGATPILGDSECIWNTLRGV